MTTAAALPNVPRGQRRPRQRAVGVGEIIGWFAGVAAAYWMYWLIAVPLIEPSVDPEAARYATEEDIRSAHERKSQRNQALAKYFPPGSWELDNPAIWETEQSLLLFKTPRPRDDGTVELRDCTLLYFPRSRDEAQSREQPIVMRASEGATLKFDEPIKLQTVDFGKRQLIGGRLNGLITIRREASRAGAGDELLITTRDIELQGDRAVSPHPVQFRLGQSHGSGRDLEIRLGAADGRPGGAFRSGKVSKLLLHRDVVAHLVLDDPALARDRPNSSRPELAGSTLKITCQGAFQYDFERHAASFHERVDVVRMSAGPSDLLNCEVLTVFVDRGGASGPQAAQPAAAGQAKRARAADDLPFSRIEARGEPVTLRSPARGIYIQCRGLDFLPIPGDSLGRFAGVGPGVMQGAAPGTPPAKYRIQWTREFRFEPAEAGQYVATLYGGATVRVANLGEISANDRTDADGRLVEEGRISTWVTPIRDEPNARHVAAFRQVSVQPAEAAPEGAPVAAPLGAADADPMDGAKWQLERVLAEGIVAVDVPQLEGRTNKLEVWIERPLATEPGGPPVQQRPQPNPQQSAISQPPGRPQAPRPQQPTRRFAVRAGGVQAKLVPDGEQFAIANLTLHDQAHLQELTPQPNTRPMVVSGERLHVVGANTEQTRVAVIGQPARVEAGGVMLLGDSIELEKHTDRLWISGPGRMMMPLAQDLNGKPLARPQTAEIAWQRSMNFQASSVDFVGNVSVSLQHQRLTTQKLTAVLDRTVDFSNPNAIAPAAGPGGTENPQLLSVRCHGEAILDSREFDERGQQTSLDQMQVFDLAIHRASGAVEARGPGWLKHVARETGERSLRGLALPGQAAPAASEAPHPRLTYLRVEYQHQITGNMHQREMTFGNSTKTVFAPVSDWNAMLSADDPSNLGPEGMVLDAAQLTVREMPAREKGKRGWYELTAAGNVLAEGAQFVALGNRVMYSQDKDQLVLEGDGRSPAEISYTPIAGGRRDETKANRIIYSPRLRHVIFSGSHSLGVEVLQPRGKPADE
jgi:hypothetical protein